MVHQATRVALVGAKRRPFPEIVARLRRGFMKSPMTGFLRAVSSHGRCPRTLAAYKAPFGSFLVLAWLGFPACGPERDAWGAGVIEPARSHPLGRALPANSPNLWTSNSGFTDRIVRLKACAYDLHHIAQDGSDRHGPPISHAADIMLSEAQHMEAAAKRFPRTPSNDKRPQRGRLRLFTHGLIVPTLCLTTTDLSYEYVSSRRSAIASTAGNRFLTPPHHLPSTPSAQRCGEDLEWHRCKREVSKARPSSFKTCTAAAGLEAVEPTDPRICV